MDTKGISKNAKCVECLSFTLWSQNNPWATPTLFSNPRWNVALLLSWRWRKYRRAVFLISALCLSLFCCYPFLSVILKPVLGCSLSCSFLTSTLQQQSRSSADDEFKKHAQLPPVASRASCNPYWTISVRQNMYYSIVEFSIDFSYGNISLTATCIADAPHHVRLKIHFYNVSLFFFLMQIYNS